MKVAGKIALCIAVASAVIACSRLTSGEGNSTLVVSPQPEQAVSNEQPLTGDSAFDENFRKWSRAGVKSYDFTASLFEGGMRGYAYPVLIQVRDGAFVSIRAVQKDNLARMDGYEEFNTVEKMFEAIRSHLGDEFPPKVKYNEKYGYPEEIGYLNPRLIDAWRSFAISKFVIVSATDEHRPNP